MRWCSGVLDPVNYVRRADKEGSNASAVNAIYTEQRRQEVLKIRALVSFNPCSAFILPTSRMKINAVLQFLVCVGALAQTSVAFAAIKWSNCTDLKVGDVPAECGTLKVPLDYTNQNTGQTLDLAVLRVRTQHKPSKGSVIFNFGGPGEGGRETLAGVPGSFFK